MPASNLFFYVGFTVAERVTYTPSFGFCMLLGLAAAYLHDRKSWQVASATVAVATAAYVVITVQRDSEWGNEKVLWEGAVKTCPNNFVSHVLLGNIYEAEGNETAALASFRESLVHNSAYMIAHLNVGRILRNQRDFPGAAKALVLASRSCDTHETCGIVTNGLGLVYADMKDWKLSVGYHKQAVEHQPQNPSWQSQLRYAEKMFETQPPPPPALKKASNEGGGAKTAQQKEADDKKKSTDAAEAKRAKVAAHQVRLQLRLETIQNQLKVTPNVAHHYRELSAVQTELGNLGAAADALKDALGIEPTNFEWVLLHATTRGRAEGAAVASTLVRAAIAEHRTRRVRLLYELGTVERDLGDQATAEATYQALLRPDTSADGATAAEAAMKDRKTRDEIAAYTAKTMVNLGVFRYNDGLKDNAIEYFKGALEADPTHQTALTNLKALKVPGY